MPHSTIMYFSGSVNHPSVVEHLVNNQVYRLFTFAAPKEVHAYLAECDKRGLQANILMDSGAFTAWNIGKPVALDTLLAYDLELLARYPQHKFIFIGLDVIPGERGRLATQVEIDAAVRESYNNFRIMLQALQGHKVLPVFHSGEDTRLRDAYLALTDYVCLSPNQNLTERQRFQWAQEIIVPGFKFHGLATTGNAMLSHIDWYSVDSFSWLLLATVGKIYFPAGNGLQVLPISSIVSERKKAGAHLSNMAEREYMLPIIQSFGYTEEDLATNFDTRVRWNIDMWHHAPWIKAPVVATGLFL